MAPRPSRLLLAAALVAVPAVPALAVVEPPSEYGKTVVLFKGDTDTERGPAATPGGGDGNTYAPEIRVEGGLWRMWYGGQGVDGYEHIHYAESTDGWNWDRQGIVLSHSPGYGDPALPEHPLIEDPSIVVVGGVYHMYYTVAHIGITDTIHLATSTDGLTWQRQGRVLDHGPSGAWDDANVGRPSVLYEDGVFKLWYDGCQGLPGGDLLAPHLGESCASFRNVGHATSTDGRTFTKHPANPILSPAEAVHVSRYRGLYVMLHENQQGTLLALSPDGVQWEEKGLIVGLSGEPHDQYGQVTPFLHYGADGKPARAYMGVAREACWCQNMMGAALLRPDALDRYIDGGTSTGPVPPSSLVDLPDVSDTFTEGVSGRVADQSWPVGLTRPEALRVENTQRSGTQTWTDLKWSFAKDDARAAGPWGGGSGRGSATGMVQTSAREGTVPGLANDWGVQYGSRTDFVVQTDALVGAGATVNITTSSLKDTQLQGDGLTVRLRPTGDARGEVVLAGAGVGELVAPFTSGAVAGQWHVYGVRFDLDDREVSVYVDDVLRGTVDLDSLAAGFTPAKTAVSVGVELGQFDPLSAQVAWFDNFLVGRPAASLGT